MAVRVRNVTVHLEAERIAGALVARRFTAIDAETGQRVQLWPELRRPVLSVPVLTHRRLRNGETAVAGT